MQSIKNTTVSIILLFLSYGVYQVITKPLPSDESERDFTQLEVSDSDSDFEDPRDSTSIAQNLNLSTTDELIEQSSSEIPAQLLELEKPTPPSFASNPSEPDEPFARKSPLLSSDLPKELENQFPVTQASSQQELQLIRPAIDDRSLNLQTSAAENSFENKSNHFESDSAIIPATVMGSVAPRSPSSERSAAPSLEDAWKEVEKMIERAEFTQSLELLSGFYRANNFPENQREQLQGWLDKLAAKVIYSTEHHLRSVPYIIQPGDTIGSLARNWQIPAQLIYNVNMKQIPDPNQLPAGTEIKLIQGPFDAEINSDQQSLTLYLGNLYAGRFKINTQNITSTGEFKIVDKSARDQIDRPFWMALSNGGSIYATDSGTSAANEIGLSIKEAEELFSILSAASTVKVLR